MRNKLMFEDRSLSATLLRIGSMNPFIASVINVLFYVSQFATSTNVRNRLTEQKCLDGGMPLENVGLVLESLGHKQIYTVSGQAVNDVDIATFCQSLIAEYKKYDVVDQTTGEVTNAQVIFQKGDFQDPNVFGQKFVIQWNGTHRLNISRTENAVENTTDGNGLPIVRNPLGFRLSFIPNEYVARTAAISKGVAIPEYVKFSAVASEQPVESLV